MKRKTLGELISIRKGKKPKEVSSDRTEGTRPCILIDEVRGTPAKSFTADTSGTEVEHSDICIVWDGANAGTVGYGLQGMIGSTISRLRPVEPKQIFTPYIGLLLQAKFSNINAAALGRGATIPHVDKNMLEGIEIPLPPLPEQKRIAGILDQADALRRLRARALEKLNTLGQAIFQEMFGDPRKEWPEVFVSDLTEDARTGPFGSQLLVSEFTETGVPVLGIDNVVQNKFVWAKERYINSEKYEQLKRYQVNPGDVLVTIMGTCGRCAVVPEGIGRAINTKHICCLTPKYSLVTSVFLQSSLIWDRRILKQLGVASIGAIMPGLNMGKIAGLKMRLPPMETQELFAGRIRTVVDQVQQLDLSLKSAESLFTSLQHRAFRGEL